MENQKAEAVLNLAADATAEELKKAEELSVGYDEGKGIWEIIIKYSGTLEETKKLSETVVELHRRDAGWDPATVWFAGLRRLTGSSAAVQRDARRLAAV